jgi:uncharacterized membrane protein (UPF0127 family)
VRIAFPVRIWLLAALCVALTAIAVVGILVRPGRGQAQTGLTACSDAASPSAEVLIDTTPRLDLELAKTPAQHEVGLMDREYLPPDSGMLFVYQAESREGYWMYHTLIPLSIAWIDRGGTIVDIQDMPRLNDPYNVQEASRTVFNPAAPYWYALEVNEGWFLEHGVGVGQQITFCLP